MKRTWFEDSDGTYYRNCVLVEAEMERCLPYPWRWLRHARLHREFRRIWLEGCARKDRLSWGDRLGTPMSMRDAYPQHPVLWTLDADSSAAP